LAKDPEGRPKGFAHVEFMAAEDVDQALKLSGEDLNGRDVKVDFAVRKQDSGFRGRRGNDRPRRGSGFHHYEGARY
jgi:nucleolin